MKQLFIFSILFSLIFLSDRSCFAQPPEHKTVQANSAITTSYPDIPLDELGFMLNPMTSDELLIEAEGWLALLKETVTKISKEQLKIFIFTKKLLKIVKLTKTAAFHLQIHTHLV